MFGFLAWLAAGLVLLITVPLYPRLCFVVYRNAAPLVGIALAIDLLSLPFALIKRARVIVSIVLFASSYFFGIVLWTFLRGRPSFSGDTLGCSLGLCWQGLELSASPC
jgi:hypothetical protein